jgi:hypothetical protein
MGPAKVAPAVQTVWKRAALEMEKTRYLETGERETPPHYYCRITPNIHDNMIEPFTVTGRFVPNKLTPDSNSNRRLDIFRCKMTSEEVTATHGISMSEYAYRNYANSSGVLQVEILRAEKSLITYRIPWKDRRTGFLSENRAEATKFDVWKGFDRNQLGEKLFLMTMTMMMMMMMVMMMMMMMMI